MIKRIASSLFIVVFVAVVFSEKVSFGNTYFNSNNTFNKENSKIIKEITVNYEFSDEDNTKEVLSLINIFKNQSFNPDDIKWLIETLRNLTIYENITVNVQEIDKDFLKLNLYFSQRKIHTDEIQIYGNYFLTDKELKEEIESLVGKYFSIERLLLIKQHIIFLYQSNGYYFVNVDFAIEQSSQNKRNLKINITEGNQIYVKECKIQGSKDEYLKEIRKILNLLKNKEIFNIARYEEALNKLKDFYLSKGYLNVKVEPELNFENNFVSILFKIEENNRFKINTVNFLYDEKDIMLSNFLKKVRNIKKGEYVNVSQLNFLKKNISEKLMEMGYLNAEVRFEFTFINSEQADIYFFIEKGNRFYIGDILLLGVEDKNKKRVKNLLSLEKNEIFNYKTIENNTQKLEKFFKDKVLILIKDSNITNPSTESFKKDLIFICKDSKSFQFEVGGMYNNWYKFSGYTNYENINFLNRGYLINFNTIFGNRIYKGELNLVNPYFLKMTSLKIKLLSQFTDELEYEVRNNFIEFGINRNLNKFTNFDVLYRLSKTNIYNSIFPLEEIGLNNYKTSSLLFMLTYDNRNHFWFSDNGKLLGIYIDLTSHFLGSDLDFLKCVFIYSQNYKQTSNLYFNPMFRLGYIFSLGEKTIPMPEKFRLGNSDLVRGLPELSLYHKGYNGVLVVNLEEKLKILENAKISFFIDCGSTWDNFADIPQNLVITGGIEFGFYNRLLGIIKFGYGHKIWGSKYSNTGNFYFNFGNIF